MRYREAIGQAILDAMADPAVLVLGAGVTDAKGVFGTCLPAHAAYPERVFETPLSENMLTGALVGMSLAGLKPIYVHARADFAFLSFEHLINTAAKWRETHGSDKPLPMVVRMLVGRGWGQGPQHSQNVASMLAHVPGLRLLMPCDAESAYSAIREALACGQPTIIIEQRRLYDTEDIVDAHAPWRDVRTRFWDGQPALHLIAFSGAWSDILQAQRNLEQLHLKTTCLCVQGWPVKDDYAERVSTSGRLIVVDADWVESGLAAEIISHCAEQGALSAAPIRIGPPRTACPTATAQEAQWYPTVGTIVNAALRMMGREPVTIGDIPDKRDGRKEPF